MLSKNLIFLLSRTRCIYCNNPPSSRMKGRAYWGLSHKWAYTASDSAIWMNGTFSELVSEMVSHLRFYKIKTKLKENDDVLWSLMNVNVIFSVNPIHYYVQLFPQKSHFYLNIKVKSLAWNICKTIWVFTRCFSLFSQFFLLLFTQNALYCLSPDVFSLPVFHLNYISKWTSLCDKASSLFHILPLPCFETVHTCSY